MTDNGNLTRTFPIGGSARLYLRNVDGVIDIATGEAGQMAVQAIKHAGPGYNQTEIEISQAADGQVSVITHYFEDLIARLFHPLHTGPARVDYTVRLPKDCQVDVAFVSGQARLQNLAGEIRVRSVSGPITLQDLAGRVEINTVSGPVSGLRLTLARGLQLETVSGDAVFDDSAMAAIAANSVSGLVRLQGALGAGPYQFRSVSGDVKIITPSLAGCQVDMHALSGRLRANAPARRERHNGGHMQMTFMPGNGAHISFNSVSGDLDLATADGQPALEPAAGEDSAQPAAPPAGPDRLAILERVSRGELSVDEALTTLKD